MKCKNNVRTQEVSACHSRYGALHILQIVGSSKSRWTRFGTYRTSRAETIFYDDSDNGHHPDERCGEETDEVEANQQQTDEVEANQQQTDEVEANQQQTDEVVVNQQQTDEVEANQQQTDEDQYEGRTHQDFYHQWFCLN